MEHICIITAKYPTSVDKTALTFVQQLAWSMADQGKRISVICPLPVNLNRNYRSVPEAFEERTYHGSQVNVYCPKFFGLGQKTIGKINTARFTSFTFYFAVKKVVQRFQQKPDTLYGHFFTPSGVTACKLGTLLCIPSFIAYGESSTWSIDHYGRDRVRKAVENVTGIISVSSKNKEELCNIGITSENKIEVFPNGYNPDRFNKKDKREARDRFGIPQDAFVVGFVGHFIKRKGIDKLVKAINNVEGAYLICAGKGELKPTGESVLFADLVEPEDLAWFYSAADIFVLPTQNEGCCNAIIEAMACGLPIVSSDLPFNYDILNRQNALLINPDDIDEISIAIQELKVDDQKRKNMSEKALERAETLTIQWRTQNILNFMEKMIGRE